MATHKVYATAVGVGQQYGVSQSGTWANVLAGTATAASITGAIASIGVDSSTATPVSYQYFVEFNTSGISGVSSVTLTLVAGTGIWSGFPTGGAKLRAAIHDYGGGVVTNADYVPSASITGAVVAELNLSSDTTDNAPYDFTSFSAFTSNINSSGNTRLLLTDDYFISGVEPDNDGAGPFYGATASTTSSNYPSLTITDTSTQNSQTINAGTTSFTPTVTGVHDIECWGGGGCQQSASTSQEGGGNGGAYGFSQVNVTSLSAITVSIGASTSTPGAGGNPTWWSSNSFSNPGANGASFVQNTVTANDYTNTIEFSGGAGPAAQGGGGNRGGSGGGSSAGTAANGANGTAGSGSGGGAGGTAPTGGGNGGNGGNGGASGQNGTVPGGGAGGGGSSGGNTGTAAAGRMIVYWYTYPAVGSFPPFLPYMGFQHMAVR